MRTRSAFVSFLFVAPALSGCMVTVGPAVLCADPEACGGEDYCDFPSGDACGHEGSRGLCTPRPGLCPEYASPVCGCDGVTYANPCLAHGAGIDVARSGTCEDPCVPMDAHPVGGCALFLGYYWDGTSCQGLGGCSCEGVDCGRGTTSLEDCESAHETCTARTCDSSAACEPGEWCDFADASGCGTAALGLCRPRPTACPPVIHPVCGCDGETHSSACDANVAGIDVAYDGACTSGSVCGGFAGFTCTALEWCDYPEGALCGAADQTGTCRPRPDACTTLYAPVCGCDGRTYGNACVASAGGTDVAHDGACGSGACGGGVACGATEWCDVLDGSTCDGPGTCRPRPAACPDLWAPVCGCDDTTYSNSCDAEAAGTDVAYSGECDAACALISTLSRACTTDSDCVAVVHQINCCGTEIVTGLSASETASFTDLEVTCRASYPACGCPTAATTTDTGELVTDVGAVHAACVARGPAGICMTYVSRRPPDGV